MTKKSKANRFTAIGAFVATGLVLVALVIRLLPPDGRLDLSNLAAAIFSGAVGVYFWRQWKRELE